jgi:hypothetical protein
MWLFLDSLDINTLDLEIDIFVLVDFRRYACHVMP